MTFPRIQKKHMFFVALVLLLCITGYANYAVNQSAGNEQPVAIKGEVEGATLEGDTAQAPDESGQEVMAAQSNYFAEFRAQRVATREQEIAYLDSIIGDERTDAETLAEAQQRKLDLVANMELETTVEGLVMAKGFNECIATIKEGSVNIVVDNTETLNSAQASQIMEIVRRETNAAPENIKIMPKN